MIDRLQPVRILTMKLIPNVSQGLCSALGIGAQVRSIGLISTDCDDATYMALDEATKAANVEVVYGRSMYAGAANASTRFAGEVIGILAGVTPSEVSSGMQRAAAFLSGDIGFRAANEEEDVVFLAHCVSRSGAYLSEIAQVQLGSPLAYLVAPPVEAVVGLDAALKAADVKLVRFFEPPTETNFAGGLLTGTQSACQAACEAFGSAVKVMAKKPLDLGGAEDWNWKRT